MSGTFRDNFAFKLSATKYHIEQIQKTYHNNQKLFKTGNDNARIRPIFYHYHAVVYELSSALEMILQLVNEQEVLDFESDKVFWKDDESTKFQRKLQRNSPQVYGLVKDAFIQDWNVALRSTRNHLLHQGVVTLQIEYNESGIAILNPIIGNKIYYFDINLWGEKISELFKILYTDK